MMGNIYKKIKSYSKKQNYPFHMPGHKRMAGTIFEHTHPFEVDFTEIDGLDDLHDPQGMFRDSMDNMKKFYGTEETFFLVNGSTSGIMAAITSVCDLGDEIIIGRNCHKSVYKAVELLGLHPIYLYPDVETENGLVIGVSCEQLKKIVEEHPNAKAVVLVNPTYEGMVMNIEEVAMLIKGRNMMLIVDEAHGAHFSFADDFPESAISQGADFVIQSLHKTMPALTQTALLHVCTKQVEIGKVQDSIDYFETTSPSYLLTSSIDDAFIFGISNKELFHKYFMRLQKLRCELKELKYLNLVDTDDPGKLVISTAKTSMTGKQLYDILLKEYHLQMEMAQDSYCLAMTSVCDTEEGYQRLIDALFEIDRGIKEGKIKLFSNWMIKNQCVFTPYEAKRKEKMSVMLQESLHRVSGEYVYLYPPGIPLLVPGEKMNQACIEKICEYLKKGFTVKGIDHNGGTWIKILKE